MFIASGFGTIIVNPNIPCSAVIFDWESITTVEAKKTSIRWCANECCQFTRSHHEVRLPRRAKRAGGESEEESQDIGGV